MEVLKIRRMSTSGNDMSMNIFSHTSQTWSKYLLDSGVTKRLAFNQEVLVAFRSTSVESTCRMNCMLIKHCLIAGRPSEPHIKELCKSHIGKIIIINNTFFDGFTIFAGTK